MRRTYTNHYNISLSSHPTFSHPQDASFICPRCQGLFVQEFCMDIHDGTGENGFWALRCLQCGELLDPLILQHRTSEPQPVLEGRSRQKSPLALS